jgi:type IV secretory pathway VirB4 component
VIKTLKTLFQQDKERFAIPRSVQAAIPIQAIWADGIFQVGKNKYAQTFRFADINYAVASQEDKETMFLAYSELLNSLDSGATTKITINNRRLNQSDFEQSILLPMADDTLNAYRTEYNQMLSDKAAGANAIVQEKYLTISIYKKNIEEARNYFARIGAELSVHLARIGSQCTELNAEEKLRIFHDFYRTGEETAFHFDLSQTMKKGHSFKDFICPDTFEFARDFFRMGDRYGRVIFLREYAAYIKDSMIAELCECNRNMLLSIDVIPVPTDEAVREVENRLLGVETNITNWQRKQNQNNNFSAVIPYDLEQQRKESKEFLDDLTTRDQRMMFSVLTLAHTADTKKQLDSDTEALLATARKHLCQFGVLRYQQMDGLNTALPLGVRKINALRTLTTESLAIFMPFRVQEVRQEKGVYYGQNVISKNMIIANRRQLLNGNSFILGVSGSGKSFTAKEEMTNIILADPNADVIIIDPEREYSPLVKAMQGEVIHISATSKNHINAMDLNSEYGDGANPVILKSEFILSLCEQLIGNGSLGAKQKSIIDRCTANVYRYYQQGNYQGTPPTLQDFREQLQKQNEPEAQEIALAIELFTDGSLNTFARHTNVDTHSRLICYDILDLGKQLQPIGMLVVLDSILNRITQNRVRGRNTFIFIDEIYLLFQHEYSANFLFTLWKRVRKYGAYCTGITQNVDDLLQSHTARTMLANSEFLIMLNQASTDRIELARLLNISDLQMSYITDVGAGQGLLKVGSTLVPFINQFPRNTELYRLMTTRFGEDKTPKEHIHQQR